MEETGMTIQLANKDYISPFGIVRDVHYQTFVDPQRFNNVGDEP